MDKAKEIFPNEFSLTREVDDHSGPCCVSESSKPSKKKGKKRLVSPNVYLYEAPRGLAEHLRKLAAENDTGATYALVTIKPTRVSEETLINKDDDSREERDNVEFEITSIALPDVGEPENQDADAIEDMKKAAKAAGVKFDDESEEEESEEEESEEDEE